MQEYAAMRVSADDVIRAVSGPIARNDDLKVLCGIIQSEGILDLHRDIARLVIGGDDDRYPGCNITLANRPRAQVAQKEDDCWIPEASVSDQRQRQYEDYLDLSHLLTQLSRLRSHRGPVRFSRRPGAYLSK